jgi:hypothetical protein
VHVNESEIRPIVYETWPNALNIDRNDWPKSAMWDISSTNNHTDLDDLFQWRDMSEGDAVKSDEVAHARPGSVGVSIDSHPLIFNQVFRRFPDRGQTVS